MKNIVFLWIVSILFTGCFNYRPISAEAQEIKIGKRYKIKTETIKKLKADAVQVNDSTLTLKRNGEIVTVPFAEITEIEQLKFSYWETITLGVVSAFIVACIVAINNMSLNIPLDMEFPN